MNGAQAPKGLRWWFPQMPAERLAVLRILVGTYSVIYFTARLPYWLSFSRHRPIQFQPVGLLRWLEHPLHPAVYQTFVAAAVLTSVLFLLGAAYRLTAPLFALCLGVVLTYANCWGAVLHTDNLWLMHVWVLALAPAADAHSFDHRNQPVPPAHFKYGWAVRLMCWICVLTYFLAGLAKLKNSGLAFVEGDSLRNFVAMDNVRKIELGSVHSPLAAVALSSSSAFQVLAAGSLLLELLAPLVMLQRKVAKTWAVAMWCFHVGVLALMAIVFLYPLTFVAFAPFFRTERLSRWIARRRAVRWVTG
ncbi:MAG: HTTM domain-containing protein [Myxococcales bacterium]|jgi:hypothetical protein